MTYRHEIMPDEPILVAYIDSDYSVARDMAESDQKGWELLDTFDEPAFFIVDLTQLTLNVNDVIQGANQGSRGERPLWHHPNIREIIMISQSKLIRLAAPGMNTLAFGFVGIKVFDHLDEALAYCREKIHTD